MSESTKRQQAVLWAFAFGFAIGGIVLHYVEAALAPTDKTEAGRKISDLQSHVTEQGETIERLDSEKSQLTKQVSDLQDSVNRANKEVEEAKAAKPDRYKVIKEGARTWRLDSATGKVCLLLASEAAWKDPQTASQSCAIR
jgi:hypothetical protein